MFGVVVIVILAGAVLVGTTLGGRYRVAPPVLLIVIGSLLGLIPRLSHVALNPDIVLFLFLPAILYRESLTTSLREIRANLRVIALSGVALVIVTMVTVSYIAQALGVDSRAAWVLGAVLAPTDAAAVAGLAKNMPRRTLTTLQAESLINDGTALVLFAIAVSAATHGDSHNGAAVVGWFAGSYAGGLLAGLVVSSLVVVIRRRLDDPMPETALSVLTPFLAFLLADEMHASGVVAVVVSGLVISYYGPTVIGAQSRILAFSFWNVSTFLLNGGLFTFVGIQITRAARGLDSTSILHAFAISLAVTGVVIATRLFWVLLSAYLLRALDRRASQRERRVGWRQRLAGGWAGFRGAVSLATALAVPAALDSGAPFPDRDLLVFTTAVVILVTVIVQGTTLPMVMRWAGLNEDPEREEEVRLARRRATQAGLAALPQVAAELGVTGGVLARLEAEYEEHAEALEDLDETESDVVGERELARQLRLGVLRHKRMAVTALRDARDIDDFVLREVQATLDIEEIRLTGLGSD
jgi:CPA1 family monovalent cation:H+ antiporter